MERFWSVGAFEHRDALGEIVASRVLRCNPSHWELLRDCRGMGGTEELIVHILQIQYGDSFSYLH